MPPDPEDVDAGESPEDAPADAASPEKVERIAHEFREAGRPYARVTVVRREPPVSANVGDRALVTPDGDLIGWIGGAACAQSVVVQAAEDALAAGEPVLVGLAPDPEDVDRPGLESYPLTCHSEGTLELFVEPVSPAPSLVVVGNSPIARTLARLATELTYEVTLASGEPEVAPAGVDAISTAEADLTAALDNAAYAVVASMGTDDEVALAAALQSNPSYVGLVASDERRDEVAASVADRLDMDPDAVVSAVTTPAGLDVGAKTAEGIAVSVLAELVAHHRDVEGPISLDVADPALAGDDAPGAPDGEPVGAESGEADRVDGDTVVDPVCGMEIDVDDAAETVEHEGATYHFCGPGCADAFKADPGRYIDTEMTTSG